MANQIADLTTDQNLKIGDLAPDFTLNDSHDQKVTLSEFAGQKNIVLYFYPKDDTAGCTLEAQGFSARKANFAAIDTIILGVSKDDEKSHQKFCDKYELDLTLLSDPEHKIIERYGAWQLKNMMGNQYMGTTRLTFLIDKKGVIKQIWPAVKPAGHAQAVLERAKNLLD